MQKSQLKTRKTDIKSYNIEAEIGHGASGICYKATSKLDNSVCAIKKISINTLKGNSLKSAQKEVQVLKELNHPNIIKYYNSFIDQGNLYIVMQYAPKGDLHAMLKRRKIKGQFYGEAEIWDMARQLAEALRYLHSKNVVHRDFKTLNIFIGEKNNLLVGDLGVSKIIKNDMGLYSRVGTPLYLAPQIIKYQKYDYKADIWGFGCVMYIVSALSHPFQGKNIINLGQNIMFNEPKPIPNYSTELNTFVRSLLEKNPAKRPDASSLLQKYFSPEAEKLREKSRAERTSIKPDGLKIQVEEKERVPKYNTFMDGSSFKRIQKATPKFSSDMELKQKKENKIELINSDQTIILHPSNIKIDAPQQKTRTRALFSTKSKFNSNWIMESSMDEKNKDNGQVLIEKALLEKRPQPSRQQNQKQKQKVQTQTHEIIRKELSPEHFLKHRSIQSAKPRKQASDPKESYSSCQKLEKQFVISSVNRIFFQAEAQNESKKAPTRPKSSMGRKALLTSNQIKFVKRRNTSEQQNMSHTRTQLLRKPQVIII